MVCRREVGAIIINLETIKAIKGGLISQHVVVNNFRTKPCQNTKGLVRVIG